MALAVFTSACGNINSGVAVVAELGLVFMSRYFLQEVLKTTIPMPIPVIKFLIFNYFDKAINQRIGPMFICFKCFLIWILSIKISGKW
jgi:hypothetical protein